MDGTVPQEASTYQVAALVTGFGTQGPGSWALRVEGKGWEGQALMRACRRTEVPGLLCQVHLEAMWSRQSPGWARPGSKLAGYTPPRDAALHLQRLGPALVLVGVLAVLHVLLKGALVLYTLGPHEHPAVTEGQLLGVPAA